MAELLERSTGQPTELVPIRTSGDERSGGGRPGHGDDGRSGHGDGELPEHDDKARFVKEIERALLDGDVDLGVHSAKDVPGDLPDGLAVVGVPGRADARDVLCGAAALEALPPGATIGTSSLRRRAQLLAERPDLRVLELRGNVDTRLRRLAAGDYDAIVLAAAGLARLELGPGAPLPPSLMTPAPGQGCLLLEARAGDGHAAELAAAVTDRESLLCLTAERALVGALGASCRTPVGAHAQLVGDELSVTAFVGVPDGDAWVRDALTGAAEDAGELGRGAAERLLAAGAGELLRAAEAAAGAAGGPPAGPRGGGS